MNCIQLLGRLTADPETRKAGKDHTVTSFTIAIDRGYGEDKKADFILCEAWGARGEFVEQYFGKGNRIAVTGQLNIDKWQDEDDAWHERAKVTVNNVDFCESAPAADKPSGKKYSRK